MRKSLLLIILTLFGLSLSPAYAQAPEGQEYTVQKDDWLSKIAEKEYGDPLAYPAIVEATNAKAAEDDGFIVITNPHVIKVGQTVKEQIENSLALEMKGVGTYNSAVQIVMDARDAGSRDLIERMIVESEKSIDWCEAQLDLIEKVGIQNYLAQRMGSVSNE